MKILLLFPMADGQTGPAIKYAFEQLEHEVEAVDAKRAKASESYKYCCEFKPDLVFCSRTYQLTEDVASIKKWFKDATICMWNVDTRTDINKWEHLFPLIKLVDYYFVVASRLVPEWKELNPNTFWLPQGLQDEVYHKPCEITENDKNRYSCDISFAGKMRASRRLFFNAIDEMNLKFRRWGNSGMPKIYNERHNKMVSLSKINFCCSGWSENGKVTSVRNYKIMGAGGFVLELYRTGLYDIFPSDTIDDYEDTDELMMKIRYWLDHEKERNEIAERGFKWVHANATYTHRIKRALEIMKL